MAWHSDLMMMMTFPFLGPIEENEIFTAGQGGYHTYRIPALVVSKEGTVLALCEGRKYSADDAGKIDLVLKRSFDHGRSWQGMQIVVSEDDMTCGNPCPVIDGTTGLIWLLFCKNLGGASEALICEGKAPRTVWITSSSDEGATWREPLEITEQVKDPSWTWYATGPGHGIQLRTGRLVVPCDHLAGRGLSIEEAGHSHVIYSDDHGLNWRIGGMAERGTNECCVVETSDGSLYLNCRNYRGAKRRAYARSYDAGRTFTDFGWDEALIEPVCQGSMVRVMDYPEAILFSNPASTDRERMTIRISYDGCRTWGPSQLLYAGPSAYSDLAVSSDRKILCLYERGSGNPYEKLTLARLNMHFQINQFK
jgi:sialidase-1